MSEQLPATPAPVVLGFFAHPDDETLSAGGILALLAPRARVHVITATRGEMGEVVAPAGQRTQVDRAQLPHIRTDEVRGACASLGVTAHEFLDQGTGQFKDSGMQWEDERRIRAIADPAAPAEAFSRLDPDEIAPILAKRIVELQPMLVITEEPAGGYGHPDHIQCHEVMMRAVALAAPEWKVPFVTFAVHDAERVRAANRELVAAAGPAAVDEFGVPLNAPDLAAPLRTGVREHPDVVLPTSHVSGEILGALRAHKSQVHVVEPHPGTEISGCYALTNNDVKPILTHAALMLAPGWGTPKGLREFLLGLGLPVFPPIRARESRLTPLMIGVLAFVSGITVAFAGSFTHRANPPWGILLALTAVLAGAVMSRTLGSVNTAFSYALGAVGSVLLIGSINRGGDIVIANDILGLSWMVGLVIVTFLGTLVGGAAVKSRPRMRRATERGHLLKRGLRD